MMSTSSMDMAFEEPNRLMTTMDMGDLGEMKMLMAGNEVFMSFGDEWVTFDYSDIGIDLEALEDYDDQRGADQL